MNRFIRLPLVKSRTGLSRSTIYAKVKAQTFPAPVPLGDRAVGWVEDEVTSWIDTCIHSARSGGGTDG